MNEAGGVASLVTVLWQQEHQSLGHHVWRLQNWLLVEVDHNGLVGMEEYSRDMLEEWNGVLEDMEC